MIKLDNVHIRLYSILYTYGVFYKCNTIIFNNNKLYKNIVNCLIPHDQNKLKLRNSFIKFVLSYINNTPCFIIIPHWVYLKQVND